MADGRHDHLENYLVRVIVLFIFFYCGNLSKFESCNGDAFNVFAPKRAPSSLFYLSAIVYILYEEYIKR